MSLCALGAAACGAGEPALEEATVTVVAQTLEFAREAPRGVSAGFNLDGLVSGTNDGRTCNKEDFAGPAGEEGVDNELARLLPLIDLAGEGALQALVQDAVNEGRLLMFFEVFEGEAGQARLRVRRGTDVPLLGTDGFILPGQTLALDHSDPLLGEGDATWAGGVLEAGPFPLAVPIVVFSQLYEVNLPQAHLRFEFDEEGNVRSGTVGGGIPVAELVQVLRTASNFGPEFEELFGDAVRDAGDLARAEDGSCAQMSAALTIQAVPAFVWE
jgi:hypothetical protein